MSGSPEAPKPGWKLSSMSHEVGVMFGMELLVRRDYGYPRVEVAIHPS